MVLLNGQPRPLDGPEGIGAVGAGAAEAAERSHRAAGDGREDFLETKHLDRVPLPDVGRELPGQASPVVEQRSDLGLLLCDVVVEGPQGILRPVVVVDLAQEGGRALLGSEAREPVARQKEVIKRPEEGVYGAVGRSNASLHLRTYIVVASHLLSYYL